MTNSNLSFESKVQANINMDSHVFNNHLRCTEQKSIVVKLVKVLHVHIHYRVQHMLEFRLRT